MTQTSQPKQHTPGPWKVFINISDNVYIESADGLALATMFYTGHPENIKQDARLMAAAPDLLAALVSASQLIPVIPLMHPDDIQALQTRVLNAIAKATGE